MACLFLIGVGLVNAQTRTITGKVISAEDGEPIIGASVMVKGTQTGTVTDVRGQFTISVPANANTLWISYVGMRTQEVEVRNNITVRLETDTRSLDEVVVTALGISREKK